GWEQFVTQSDAFVAEMLSGMAPLADSALHDVAGVATYVLTPNNAPTGDDAPIYRSMHGGALIMCGGDLTRVLTEVNAAITGIINWAPDYRMPPAHPYPAALDDVMAVYRALLQVRDPSRIIVGGGSAGGNLAAAML